MIWEFKDNWSEVMDNFNKLIANCQIGKDGSLNDLLNILDPIITKYYKLSGFDDDIKAEFYLAIYKIVQTIKLDKFPSNNPTPYLLSYIKKSLSHKYIELSKKRQKIKSLYSFEYLDVLKKDLHDEIEETDLKVSLNVLINCLPKPQKEIILRKYYYGYSDTEIAQFLKISRQDVNKLENKALLKLKKIIQC